MIAENIAEVRKLIKQAADKSGRDVKDIKLIAVSKTKPMSLIQEAYDVEQRDFGENHVQELQEKIPAMASDIRWHMIGTLQRNKVKYIIDKVSIIHSVDSIALAEQIEKEACKKNCEMDILLEVNVGEEESKSGFSCDEAMSACIEIAKLPHVHIKGLMTVAPFVDDPELNRPVFAKLRNLSVDIQNKNIDNVRMCELSMGMSGDYLVAIEEGATMVRVGTGIFGERNYNK